MSAQEIAASRCYGGWQRRFSHVSSSLNCEMHFSVYLPPQAESTAVPVVFWLSGLTCTDENFVAKAGAQRYAAELGVALVAPDTSPRGDDVPDDPEAAYDLGLGAGFYVNATQSPWSEHYHMYDYVVEELPAVLAADVAALDMDRQAIAGHSMGGHGAMTIALKNPGRFSSVSAFAPICSPCACPWGEKALGNYLGPDRETWAAHDTVALVHSSDHRLPVLVDQGTADGFLEEQLKTPLLEAASRESDFPMHIRMQEGYDHSYFFISSFIGEHLAFHAENMAA